jgi:Mg/Co/Ni transporter MgtE
VVKEEKNQKVKDLMTTRVIKTSPDEHVDVAAQKLERYNISALPVVDEQNKMVGLLTAIDLGKLFGKRWQK